jgi:hypothetical protein
LAFLLACFCLAAPLQAQTALDAWLSEPLGWQDEVVAEGPITLVNLHGDLRVRGKPRTKLEIVGYAQHHVDDTREVTVVPVREGDGWRLEVTMAETDGEEAPEEWADRRVDLTIYVPWTSPLTARTGAGTLEVLDMRAALGAETESGDLVAGSSRDLVVKSRSGSVRAMLQEPGWSSTATIETFSGPVVVWARPDADTALTFETRGTLTTDFTLEIERLDASQRRARAELGAGSGTVQVTSYQAPLALREVVPAVVHPAGATEEN